MTFAPARPAGGLIGRRLLDRTYEAQLGQFSRSPAILRDVTDFVARAGEPRSPEAFVRDTRLLRVALGAFGLEDELPKRAFIRRILEEGTIDPRSLANRLTDPAWRRFAEALGFGDGGIGLASDEARVRIAGQYRVRQFERAVGEQDVDLRLALNFRREIGAIAEGADAGRSGWFRIIGSEPLRRVVAGAFGLPDSLGRLDIDAQRDRLSGRARALFGDGSPSVFTDPGVVEETVRRCLASSATASSSVAIRGSAALALLGNGGVGPAARAGLFASSF